jgi:diaminopimelate decarboxylase
MLRELAARTGAERIDLGGGYRGEPARYAAAIGRELRDPRRLIVEPGRSIVGAAGWLLTRVVRVQPRGHLVADAGMTELIRPMLYGARHPVHLLAPGAPLPGAGPWTLSGPICEAGDLLADDLRLDAAAGEGALLAIGDAGAYGLAMASSYNGRLRPAQVVLEGGAARLSRRRETWEDVIARDA